MVKKIKNGNTIGMPFRKQGAKTAARKTTRTIVGGAVEVLLHVTKTTNKST